MSWPSLRPHNRPPGSHGWCMVSPDNIVAALGLSFLVENGPTDGTSFSTRCIVKTSSRRALMPKVSGEERGGDDVFVSSA